jgi:predicted outer membrane repeat protein
MDRIMSVGPATSAGLPTVSLESVILLSGTTDGSGGALHVDGNVTVTRSVVQANSAGESGGGVFATGAVVVETSIFRRNSTGSPTCNAPSPCLGGAIFASGESGFGGVSISASCFTMNSSSDFGGAIGVNDTVTVAGSSFDLNRAGTQGGAISGGRRVELTNSTITDNEASACGGLDALEVNLLHTTVVLNEAATGANLCAETLLESDGSIVALPAFGNGPNCALDPAAVTRSSYSFAGDQSCQMVDATDRVGPPLASLGETSFNNGFTDQPIWVPFGDMGQEQFVDVIPSASCNVAQDQRGVPRPQGSACDIGSIEVTAGDVGGRPPGNKPPGHPGHHPPGNPHPGHHPPGNPHPGNPNPGARRPAN